MSADNTHAPAPTDDAMAADWAAALAEAKPRRAGGATSPTEQVAPAPFASFAPTRRRDGGAATTST